MPYTTYEGETPTVITTGGNSNDSGFGFGSGWGGLIGLVAVAAIFGGLGGGGIFGNGNNNGALTREQACIDNNFQNLMRETAGISDAVNLGFANLNSTICNQQYDTANMINNLGMNIMQGFNASNVTALQGFNGIQSQLAQCCCNIERGIERLGCQSASETAAIIQSQQNGVQKIIDYLCNEKISALQAENIQLSNAISQANQTRTLIDTLLPVARPAYITCSPYASAFGFPGYGYNGYNGNNGCCGCNG